MLFIQPIQARTVAPLLHLICAKVMKAGGLEATEVVTASNQHLYKKEKNYTVGHHYFVKSKKPKVV